MTDCAIKTDAYGREWHVGDFILVPASATSIYFGRICGFTAKQIKYKCVWKRWGNEDDWAVSLSYIKATAFVIVTQHSIPEEIFRLLDAVELE